MQHLLLICADEDADVTSEEAAGDDDAERTALDETLADVALHPLVRFDSVDVRPAWWRRAA